jgi:hypothetical protein
MGDCTVKRSLLGAFLAAFLISGLVFAGAMHFGIVRASTDVRGIPKPSVPEFTVKLIDSSYDVPTTYSLDPYTGENVTHTGYHVEQQSIEVKIKNQPFTPYEMQDSNGNNQSINFFYNIRIKGQFSEDWTELYRASDGYPHQWSDSDYTALSYVLGGDADTVLGTKMIKLPAGTQVDFQVEAMIGYIHREISMPIPGTGWVVTGETSGWSNTQTITIPESQMPTPSPATTPTPTPHQEPQQTALTTIIGAAIAVAVFCAGLGFLLYLIKRK